MRERIVRRLSATCLPADPAAAAEREIPAGQAHVWYRMPLRPAAVLMPLFDEAGEVSLLLTERTHDLPEHPGEVALPGGRAEPGDIDLRETALRESHEEIGLEPASVTLAGFVPAQPVITGYAVVPVVGFVDGPYEPRLDPREVSDVFRVPLDFFMDDANGTLRSRERNGVRAELWEYHFEGHRIWGATAKIIREFLKLL